jgi:hypothetical protein
VKCHSSTHGVLRQWQAVRRGVWYTVNRLPVPCEHLLQGSTIMWMSADAVICY